MKFANVRELKNKTSEVLRKAEKEDIVITRQGKPWAVISKLHEDDLEDYILEHSPVFLKSLEEARAEYDKEGGITLAAYRKQRTRKRA